MRFSSTRILAAVAALLAATSLAVSADPSAPLPQLQLHAGTHVFNVEVAATPRQREQGLMGRTHLEDGTGMLFVFEAPAKHCFWMKDTPLALSIAFLADDGTIVDVDDMRPQTLDRHCPHAVARYALEVTRGAFDRKGIRPGMKVSGGPFAE